MPNPATAVAEAAGTEAAGAARTHVTEHTVVVDAPAATVYGLVADVSAWPQVFGPTIHVEVLEEHADEQLLRIWATANDQVRSWTSHRILDSRARTVSFRQVASAHPVASMGGKWLVESNDDGGSRVVLLHDYTAVDDDPAAVELIERAVDRNSRAELAALRNAAEQSGDAEEDGGLRFTFSDSVDIGGSAEDVFAFLDRADLWPERLPHVARIGLEEAPSDGGGSTVQRMDMDTRSPDGSLHNTMSVRVCFPDRSVIVYKQLRVPVAMSGHTGRWEIEPHGKGVRATSWHTVTLDPEGVRQLLGPEATLAEARAKVRQALGANSTTTLRHAKRFAENLHDRS
ncbi:aromatase/cyclase [Streptomyces sp. CNQ085]|uniref:aromatase/cyclase n=1 Tax=Streptomyces sp. CNQ085 TaxID=2886944 RepID=UPI0027E401A7|nr:aromatase/cyclase [Streptomyces sp. CNQ085]MCI0383421.1 aromatase/cyclase [Streptomyces sp. CNQ085]